MTVLFELFFLFAKISTFSFGGGYAAFPIIMESVEKHSWMSNTEIANILALAGMSPGPVAINAAVGVGFEVAGFPGIIAAFLGITIPCAIIVIVVATFFHKIYTHQSVKNVLYILRPVVAGIIIFTAIKYALTNGILFPEVFSISGKQINSGWNIGMFDITIFEVKSVSIALLSFAAITKTKLHPLYIILISGVIGILIF